MPRSHASISRSVSCLLARTARSAIVVLIFIILLITDLLGTTDVFPFVHPLK